MIIRILYHDFCFDGAASAAYLSRFLVDRFHPSAEVGYAGLVHTSGFAWKDERFDADLHAIVDFKYSSHPRLDWWFDHHESAFLTPEDRKHFQQNQNQRKVRDTSFLSCATLISHIAREQFDYDAPDLGELVAWANLIDGAQYPDAVTAIELAAPALRLMLVVENAPNSAVVQTIIRHMQYEPLDHIVRRPEIGDLAEEFYAQHLDSIHLMKSRGNFKDGVVFFDLTDAAPKRHNKFIPYFLFPQALHAVTLYRIGSQIRLSVGTNPWTSAHNEFNLARLCERYGGGGHRVVAAVSFGPEAEVDAGRAATEILAELRNGSIADVRVAGDRE